MRMSYVMLLLRINFVDSLSCFLSPHVPVYSLFPVSIIGHSQGRVCAIL
jgi:hypothetical protein